MSCEWQLQAMVMSCDRCFAKCGHELWLRGCAASGELRLRGGATSVEMWKHDVSMSGDLWQQGSMSGAR